MPTPFRLLQLCAELDRRLREIYNHGGQQLVLHPHILSARALWEQEGQGVRGGGRGDRLHELHCMVCPHRWLGKPVRHAEQHMWHSLAANCQGTEFVLAKLRCSSARLIVLLCPFPALPCRRPAAHAGDGAALHHLDSERRA